MESSFLSLVFAFFLGYMAGCVMIDKEKEGSMFEQNDGHSERQFYIDVHYYLYELIFVHYYIRMNMH